MAQDLASITPKLGFGLMRLPKMPDDPSVIDLEQVTAMTDLFLDAGFTYFDTAYVYDNGASEEAIRKALIERYPRDRFTLTTKLNAWSGHPTEEEAKKQLGISLERTGAGYFDFYLLHAVQVNNHKVYEDYGLWDYVREQKAKGLIRHWGFSFHGTPELLDELLTKNPDADLVQLQINYADWNNSNIASRRCYETAVRHGKQMVVMEPVKGGTLADPPAAIKKLFSDANPNASYPSWAIRFVASLDDIICVLSGMSNLEQMQDNISYMKNFQKLTASEQEVIAQAQEIIKSVNTVPCTGCHYCTEGCPVQMNIPQIMRALNTDRIYGPEQGKRRYGLATGGGTKAGECIACGQCESVCPQRLPIISYLQEASKLFD